MNFSIIIVTYNRRELLRACLNSLINTKAQEIIIIINGEDSATDRLLKKEFSSVKVITTDKVTPGEARNLGVAHASGEFICFLDDDILVPENYFETAEKIINNHAKLDVFGGPDQTYPNSSFFEIALGLTLHSPLATASTRYRHGAGGNLSTVKADERKLILCNLWIRRKLFEKYQYDHRFFRNEENVLLFQLKNDKKQMGYFSELFVFHKRRTNLAQLSRSVHSSGEHRLKQFFLYPSSINGIYFVPALFLLYLILLPLPALKLSLAPLALYFLFNLAFAIRTSFQARSWRYLFLIIFFQFWINICYGSGFFSQLFHIIIPIKRQRTTH